MSAQPLEGLNVPSDVWLRIMEKCRVEEILSLEKCCKLFYNLAKSRIVWLKCLQGLEQHEAPDLPPHIPAAGLSKGELRRLVVKATKSSLSWNEIASSPSLLAKSTKEIRIHLKDVNPDEILGEPPTFRLKLFLLPGGKHLLVLWPAGYLQCWSVPEQDLEPQCLWLYPDLPEGASENRPVLLYGLDYDMQRKSRGDVHLLLVNELLQDQFMGERYVDIVCFSPVNNSLKKIYTGKNLEKTYGLPTYMGPGIRGNVFVVYQEIAESPKGTLTINFWNEDTSLTIKEATLDCLELTTEFLICVRRFQDGRRTLAVISISEIFRTINMKTSIEFSELTCTEIPIEQETFSRPEGDVEHLHNALEVQARSK
ncbi:hypothetical protein EW145_g2961 [Phellinidium pouzarii]|uniref:F-box domain-containing protein n=1 Tax=Phellinidium pouzarii TaxID=167371 RepID=A0A4S4L945_9AGAM|nr:hypothetical protein EW145_g2961 [Phellinidium pouzarii]